MNILRRVLMTSLCVSAVAGMSSVLAADIKGSKDHPLVKRYEGCEIRHYTHAAFGEFNLPLSSTFFDHGDNSFKIKKTQRVEGERTELLYFCPPGRSALEVFHNYQQELQASGFQVLYEAAGAALGDSHTFADTAFPPHEHLVGNIDPFANNEDGQRFLSAKRSRPEGDTYVGLYVTENNEHVVDLHGAKGQPLVMLEVIEPKPLEAKMVTVTSEKMASEIASSGSIALYGILFDTGKATLKAESSAALEQIAKLLAGDPSLNLFVVGHTDNAGTYAANVALSQQRAQAVTKALVAQYHIAAARLSPVGVASVAPVATNRSEAGRAKNRRVQLVGK